MCCQGDHVMGGPLQKGNSTTPVHKSMKDFKMALALSWPLSAQGPVLLTWGYMAPCGDFLASSGGGSWASPVCPSQCHGPALPPYPHQYPPSCQPAVPKPLLRARPRASHTVPLVLCGPEAQLFHKETASRRVAQRRSGGSGPIWAWSLG